MTQGNVPQGSLDSLGATDPSTVRKIVAAGSDIALIVDPGNVVRDVVLGREGLEPRAVSGWTGSPVESLVSQDSRDKVIDLLARARSGDGGRSREVNHVGSDRSELPVRYSAVGAGDSENVILLGRDLRQIAQLQRELVDAQIAMEQDYEQIRQVETRYRVLFETTQEALAVVSAETGRIKDANSAAGRLFGHDPQDLINRGLASRFDEASQDDLSNTLALAHQNGHERATTLQLRDEPTTVQFNVVLFRSISDTLYLCRLRAVVPRVDADAGPSGSLVELYGQASDAIAFTDETGSILNTNTAFLALADIATSDAVRGHNISEFLGRPTIDLKVMTDNARAKGRMANYSTNFRSNFGVSTPVEISTTHLTGSETEGFGFILRDVGRASVARGTGATVSTEAVEHIIELVGSTPLKELVRGTTDVVEKLCIETAIRLTNNNRASAAEMLGLSRQSLYVKLRKYGLIDPDE